jgi:acetyl-CoA carboxylase carboxyl transferase subunit alpha
MAADTDFEAPLRELEKRIEELARYPGDPAKESEQGRLRRELDEKRRTIFARLTPWQKTKVARHPDRPYTLDYVAALFTEFTEVHGDRRFADDPALVCGFAFHKKRPVAVIGHQKGRDTKQKIYRNFGMPKPEGYRKALRVMQPSSGGPSSRSSTRRAPIRASTRKSAARRRRSRSTCARWRRCRCRSWSR